MISAASSSVSTIAQRVLMKDQKSDAAAYSFLFQIMCAAIIAVFAFARGFVMPPIKEMPINFLLVAILFGSGNLLLFKALKQTEASKVAVLNASGIVWTVMAAFIFLGEAISNKIFLGSLLVIAGVVLVSFKKGTSYFNKGTAYALMAAMFFGLSFVNDMFIMRRAEVFSYNVIGFLFPAIFILLINPGIIKKLKVYLKPKPLLKLSIPAIFFSISAISGLSAYQSGASASQLGPIAKLSLVITLVLAGIFLNERDNLFKKSISAILILAGILLIK